MNQMTPTIIWGKYRGKSLNPAHDSRDGRILGDTKTHRILILEITGVHGLATPATAVTVLLESFTILHDSFRQTPDCLTRTVDAKLGTNRMDVTMVAKHFPQDLPYRGTLTVNRKTLHSWKLFLHQKEHPLRRTHITVDPETFKENHRERTVIEAMLTRQYHDPQPMKT